ncbi:MAG: amino acid ABC transporter substrate-binding protein [Firmicutes bacterium]|nr:amino acid ABC transporter substrate-binding protein [Bacillota bacterium]
MKKLLIFVLVISGVFITGCEKEDSDLNSLEKVLESGQLILGLDDTFAPMGFRDEDGNVVGFDIDLAKAVAIELGVELIIQPIEWDSKVLELNAGNIDMIWNGLTITEERLETINFSQPYLNNRQIVLTKSGISILTVNDLSGLKVGVQIDSSGQYALESNSIFNSISEEVKFNNFTEALLDLESGRIDAIIIDEIMARYVVSQSTYDVIVTNVSLGDEEYGIGFRLGDDELRSRIDEILNALAETGVTANISNTWFGEDIFRK